MGQDKKTPITIDDKQYVFEEMTQEQQALITTLQTQVAALTAKVGN